MHILWDYLKISNNIEISHITHTFFFFRDVNFCRQIPALPKTTRLLLEKKSDSHQEISQSH